MTGWCVDVRVVAVARQVRARLTSRLHELEPLPEQLKTAELRLQDATERMRAYERKAVETSQVVAELTAKVHSRFLLLLFCCCLAVVV